MRELATQCVEICERMRIWFEAQDYAGIDPYLLDQRLYRFRSIPLIGKIVSWGRRALKPFHASVPQQFFAGQSPVIFSKALGLMVGGNAHLYEVTGDKSLIDESWMLFEMLLDHRSPGYTHLCWGQPFAWGSDPHYPPNTPAVPVTIPVAHGILDYYNISNDHRVVDALEEVTGYLVEENGYSQFDQSLCFYYSPNNPMLVHNINIMAASFLLRLSEISEVANRWEDFASKSIRFLLEGQNEDGSWYYADPRGAQPWSKTIDHRHTGFILEHLKLALRYFSEPSYSAALERGVAFYEQHLLDGYVPRWSPKQTYPVDIHDVAQAIITSVRLEDLEMATKIVHFSLDHMYDGDSQFYYKLFRNGDLNRTVFIRWGQAWMYNALSLYAKSILCESPGA